MKQSKSFKIVLIAVFSALIAILSQIAIPLPTHIPITLQTFVIALTGYFLGWYGGSLSVILYIIIGAVGLPVFANFGSGIGTLLGFTGGFLWGFIPMAALCGLSGKYNSSKKISVIIGCALGITGLLIAHLCGVLQYAYIANIKLFQSFITVSVPYLIKDVISVIVAYSFSNILTKRLKRAGLKF